MNNEPENGSLCSNVYGNDHVMKERYDQWIVEHQKKKKKKWTIATAINRKYGLFGGWWKY